MENKNLHYILGLDLGIASVGWAVVEIDEKENPLRLIDVGVRTFERAEVPKTGESLALSRRLARATRRLTQRRVARQKISYYPLMNVFLIKFGSYVSKV